MEDLTQITDWIQNHLLITLIAIAAAIAAAVKWLLVTLTKNKAEKVKIQLGMAKDELAIDELQSKRVALEQANLDTMIAQYREALTAMSNAQAGEAIAVEEKFKARRNELEASAREEQAKRDVERLKKAIEQHMIENPHCVIPAI
jgi:chromosome segregation ATPase